MVMFQEHRQTISDVDDLIHAYSPITLAEMDDVALMDRVDTKFVMSRSQAEQVLAALPAEYRVLDIKGVRLNHYENLYFDTPGLALYMRHHAEKPLRYKVRSRAYLESNLMFFEVKQKDKRDRTVKSRLATPSLVTSISDGLTAVVPSGIAPEVATLSPTLWNRFTRVTLVNTADRERVTLDFDLEFAWGDRTIELPGVVIAEVKQPRRNGGTPFCRWMHTLGVHTGGFSKYCVGMAMVYDVKHNNFKPALRKVRALMEEYDVSRAA